MYNIYVEEKKKQQEKEKEKEKLKKQNFIKRHKRDLPSLISNYNSRIKDFILSMAVSNYSIPGKDSDKPILNTRLKYHEETNHKIQGRRGFLFFGYRSESDRINDAVEYNKILSASTPLESPRIDNNIKKKFVSQRYSQPEMRFKPKTDIERVCEAVNLNYYGKLESELINNQLLPLKGRVRKRIGSGRNSSKTLNQGLDGENDNDDKFVIIPDVKKKVVQLKYGQIPIKRIVKEFDKNKKHNNFRTHFKAVESVALNEINLSNTSLGKKSIPHIRFNSNSKCITNKVFDFEEKNDNEQSLSFPLLRNLSHSNITNRTQVYFRHKNPNNKKEISPENTADLIHLKEIAFIKENTNDFRTSKLMSAEEVRMHEEKITIGKETFGLNSEINRIAGKVLDKCNIHHKKNKNNLTQLEAKKGKLMVTHGLSIKDFLSKYKLPG